VRRESFSLGDKMKAGGPVTSRFCTLFLGIALMAAGCSAMVTSPSNPAPIRVTVQPTPTFVGGPDTATFTLKVENIGAAVVDLTFPSSCQVLPYFVNRATGQPVTPLGGGFVCLTVITSRTLRAGESFTQVHTVKAGSAPLPDAIVLPPGDYAIYARLEDSTHRVLSDQLTFSVR
jgi:hypothetical protein